MRKTTRVTPISRKPKGLNAPARDTASPNSNHRHDPSDTVTLIGHSSSGSKGSTGSPSSAALSPAAVSNRTLTLAANSSKATSHQKIIVATQGAAKTSAPIATPAPAPGPIPKPLAATKGDQPAKKSTDAEIAKKMEQAFVCHSLGLHERAERLVSEIKGLNLPREVWAKFNSDFVSATEAGAKNLSSDVFHYSKDDLWKEPMKILSKMVSIASSSPLLNTDGKRNFERADSLEKNFKIFKKSLAPLDEKDQLQLYRRAGVMLGRFDAVDTSEQCLAKIITAGNKKDRAMVWMRRGRNSVYYNDYARSVTEFQNALDAVKYISDSSLINAVKCQLWFYIARSKFHESEYDTISEGKKSQLVMEAKALAEKARQSGCEDPGLPVITEKIETMRESLRKNEGGCFACFRCS